MKGLLRHGLGFGDVRVHIEESATKPIILETLKELVETGGIIVVYFSGHGVQILKEELDAKDSEEKDTEAIDSEEDEGIVLADTSWRRETEKDWNERGGTLLTGRDLEPLLRRSQEVGGMVTLIFDCCYSGRLYRKSINSVGRPNTLLSIVSSKVLHICDTRRASRRQEVGTLEVVRTNLYIWRHQTVC